MPDSNPRVLQVVMCKQEEKLQGKDQSDSKAAAAFKCMLLKNYTRLQRGRALKASSHQYQKGPGLSGSSSMPNLLSINGFFFRSSGGRGNTHCG